MKKLKYFMLLSAAIASIAVIVSCSRENEKKEPSGDSGKREVMSERQDIEKDPTLVLSAPSPTYIMRLEDKILTLYEISGSQEMAVTSITIDPAYFPPDDIKELNKGVLAYSKEDGFAKLENFTN